MYNGISFVGYLYAATSIEVDDENNVWIGTGSWGYNDTTKLINYDGTNWTEYTAANSPLPIFDMIYDLAFDNDGNLWITTAFSGLYVFNEEGITPVELSSFSTEVLNNGVRLNWQTVSEINNSGFEIERLKDLNIEKLINWEAIGFVEGKGTTTELQSYSFVDENLSRGKYSYRLKQIDFDGTYEYSNIVEVDVNGIKEFSLFQNYPNPFNPSTSIQYTVSSRQFVSLKVYDVLGNEVTTLVNEEKQLGEYEVDFDASKLSSGIYIYQLKSGSYISSRKMTVLK